MRHFYFLINNTKNSVYICIFFFAMILTSCFVPPATSPYPHPDGRDYDRYRTPDRDYDRRKKEDEDRRRVIDRSRDRYQGQDCEDETRGHDCQEQCRDIYSRRGDREDCEELSVTQVEKLHELHELLEDPDSDELADIDSEDFDVYLNISIAPMDKLIGRYSKKKAKEFMRWLIKDEDAAKTFEKEDDDYKTLEALLKGIVTGGFTSITIYKPFVEKIDGGDKIMELAIEEGSEKIVNWFMDYINEKNDDCKIKETNVNCFKIYCKIGNAMDDDYRDNWLGFGNFEEYIEDIIESGTNRKITKEGRYYWRGTTEAPQDGYEDAEDIDDWVDDLCKPGDANLIASGDG